MGLVVLISGGSRGLGHALVIDNLAVGNTVATFSRSRSLAIQALGDGDPGQRSFYWEELNSERHEFLGKFVKAVVKRYGRVDVLINNAGALIEGAFTMLRKADVDRAVHVNISSTVHLTQACARVMMTQREGTIINVSSLNGIRGHRGVAVYGATKAALDGLTRGLARELGGYGIRVNSVAPGYFDSDMTHGMAEAQRAQIVRRTPLNRLGRVDDIVGAIRFLMSADARFITGHTLVVDGGITC